MKFLEEDSTAISDIRKQISDVTSQIDSFATPAPTEEPEATEVPADATEAPTEEPTEDSDRRSRSDSRAHDGSHARPAS